MRYSPTPPVPAEGGLVLANICWRKAAGRCHPPSHHLRSRYAVRPFWRRLQSRWFALEGSTSLAQRGKRYYCYHFTYATRFPGVALPLRSVWPALATSKLPPIVGFLHGAPRKEDPRFIVGLCRLDAFDDDDNNASKQQLTMLHKGLTALNGCLGSVSVECLCYCCCCCCCCVWGQ